MDVKGLLSKTFAKRHANNVVNFMRVRATLTVSMLMMPDVRYIEG